MVDDVDRWVRYEIAMRLVKAALAAGLLLYACRSEPTGPGRGIEFLAGARLIDTAFSEPAQAIVIRLASRESGVAVQFESTPRTDGWLASRVGRLGDPDFAFSVVDTTDSRGQAAVRVHLGVKTGDEFIRIRVPALGLRDSARITTTPASVYSLSAAPDSKQIRVGESYLLTVIPSDQFGNPRIGDPVVLVPRDPFVSIHGMTVRGELPGVTSIDIRVGPATGWVNVTVVP